jgi:hypothetical protein
MKNYRETFKDTEAGRLKIPKGTELVHVPNCGQASGFAVKDTALLIKLGVWEHDAKTWYVYIPVNAVFEALHVRAPLKIKSENWQEKANKWLIKIAGQSFDYYTGSGIIESPNYDSVMAYLVRDAEALEQSFEDWASELGYDTDSRKAYAIWEECCNNARKLISAGIDLKSESERLQDF